MLADTHRLVFVGGLHRSGTTPLTRLLGQHPEISGFSGTTATEDEGQHLQSVYPPAYKYGGPGRFALNPSAHLTEDSPLVSARNAEELLNQWAPYWDTSRPVLVEKSPPNIVMTRFLQALYPSARFVIVTRHPMVVALSTKKWRRGTGRRKLIQNWVSAHETFRSDAAAVNKVLVVKYERLVADPAQVAESLTGFLGLGTPLSTESWDARRSDVYFERWERLRASRLPWVRRGMARLEAEFEGRCRAFGYSFANPSWIGDFWG